MMNHSRMRSRFLCSPLVIAMALPWSTPVLAQDQQMVLEEMIVTARRKDESLQDVPESISAVSGDTFQELSLLKFEDLQSIVPGVNLEAKTDGYSTSASMRGASFDASSSASPTVQFYINEAPVHANQFYMDLYDIGQMEVLKGPQGTVRGISTPSGAITLTTKAPVLDEFGGQVNLTETNKGTSNYQAAINLPIVEGRLAARVAGLVSKDDANFVKSLNSDEQPGSDTDSHRISLYWLPLDNLDIKFVSQKTDRDRRAFIPVVGDGTDVLVDGPLIRPKDRLAVAENPNDMSNELEVSTLNINWEFLNHSLNYVGSDSTTFISGDEPRDIGNLFVGDIITEYYGLEQKIKSHELRFSSEEPYADVLDYSIGVYHSKTEGGNDILYYASTPLITDYTDEETAYFANLTWYLMESTELTLGARHIKTEKESMYDMGVVLNSELDASTNVYKVSLSHQFTDDVLGYATWATSWRAGPSVVGVQSTDVTNPQYRLFTELEPEESESWELGIKADFMNNRGRVNAAVFHQKFDNYIYRGKPVDYLNYLGTIDQFNFTTNADATVDGVEVDLSFQLTPNWFASASASWYDSKLESAIPCDTGVTDPAQFVADGVIAYMCDSGGAVTRNPDWSATLQSQYSFRVSDSLDGYVRGLYSYYAENDNKHDNTDIDAYGLFNLYLGVQDNNAGWEVQLFAKNLFNEGSTTTWEDGDVDARLAGGFGFPSGYSESGYTPPREVGINVRYAFGSR